MSRVAVNGSGRDVYTRGVEGLVQGACSAACRGYDLAAVQADVHRLFIILLLERL